MIIDVQAHIEGIAEFLTAKSSRRFLSLSKKKNGIERAFDYLWEAHEFDVDYDRIQKKIAAYDINLEDKLKELDAPETCYVARGYTEILGEITLKNAVKEIHQSGEFGIISCIPAKLLYFESEWGNDCAIYVRK